MTTVKVRFVPGLKPIIQKHAMHDQSSHGNWAGSKTNAGNNLGIGEAIRLLNSFDPLQQKVYAAEGTLYDKKIDRSTKPVAPILQGGSPEIRSEYEKAYKEYSKKFTEWAVEQRANLSSETAKKNLDGSPKGVKKYVEEIIKADWFVEKFGDGSSLPPLEVKTANTNASGRHILSLSRDRATGQIVSTKHLISIDRQSTKNEATILHEISHYATTISQTKSFSGHGVEFVKNHIYVVGKVIGPERASQLRDAYIAEGIQIDN
jgi:putative metallohydrolase (TIGR04338 family)